MLLWWYSPVQRRQLCIQRWVKPGFPARSLLHLGQMLWSVTSFSILFILRLFLGIGLSYMPFFSRCSLLWWIWAPCCSWKEHRAFSGLSKTWTNRWRREESRKIQENVCCIYFRVFQPIVLFLRPATLLFWFSLVAFISPVFRHRQLFTVTKLWWPHCALPAQPHIADRQI